MTKVNGDMKRELIFGKKLFTHHRGFVFHILVFMEMLYTFIDLCVCFLFLIHFWCDVFLQHCHFILPTKAREYVFASVGLCVLCVSKIRPEQIHILCPSLRISGHLPAPILNGSASRLSAEPVVPLTKASLKLRNERSRSRCFAQSTHHMRTALLSNISSRIEIPFWSSVLRQDWNVFFWNSTYNLHCLLFIATGN